MRIRQMLNVAKWRCGVGTRRFQGVRLRILNNTFGEAEQFVCDAEMYRSLVLTDFYTLAASKFGFGRKM